MKESGLEVPGFNYLKFQDMMTLVEYGKAYDSMVESLHSDNRVIVEMGQIAQRNHEKFPQTFANVWDRGQGVHFDVV